MHTRASAPTRPYYPAARCAPNRSRVPSPADADHGPLEQIVSNLGEFHMSAIRIANATSRDPANRTAGQPACPASLPRPSRRGTHHQNGDQTQPGPGRLLARRWLAPRPRGAAVGRQGNHRLARRAWGQSDRTRDRRCPRNGHVLMPKRMPIPSAKQDVGKVRCVWRRVCGTTAPGRVVRSRVRLRGIRHVGRVMGFASLGARGLGVRASEGWSTPLPNVDAPSLREKPVLEPGVFPHDLALDAA